LINRSGVGDSKSREVEGMKKGVCGLDEEQGYHRRGCELECGCGCGE
jgi:hypothetical protein